LSLRRSALVLALSLATVWAPLAHAADLTPDQSALVQKAGDYLSSLRAVTGRFTQTAANGATTGGTLWLQRPGKARFQYDPPAGLLVVADGHFVGVTDTRLKTFNEVPLRNTPLALLLGTEVRFDRVNVTGVEQTAEGFTVDARDAHGHIALRFSADPMALKGWTLTDGQGRRTRVALGPLAATEHLAAGLFYIRDAH
jgi:outer membrane lipoprotein-sorting protein